MSSPRRPGSTGPSSGVILLRHRVDVTALSQALRSGVREVVVADDHSALVEALRRSSDLTARLIGHAGGGPVTEGKVVTVFSAKGGVGKTTLSTNLGTYLASTGAKTLLLDLDLAFGDVAISLQLMPEQVDLRRGRHVRQHRRAGDRRRSSPSTRPAAATSSAPRTTRATPTASRSARSPS